MSSGYNEKKFEYYGNPGGHDMFSGRYQQGLKLKKVLFLLCVCFCVTLWDFWSEADEAYAKLNMIEKAKNDLKLAVKYGQWNAGHK